MQSASAIRLNLHSIHGLRGFAALIVLLAHSVEHGKYGNHVALFTGRFGVEVFFVISGIVIFLAAGPHSFDPRSFATKRFFRIVPLYWLTTLLVAVLAILAPSTFRSTEFDLSYLIKSLIFVPDLVIGRETDWRPLFKLGWTLNYEMFFYLLVAASCVVPSFQARFAVLSAALLALIGLSFLIEPRASVLAFYANLNLLPFLGGVAIGFLIMRSPAWLARLSRFAPVLVLAAAGMTFMALDFEWEDYRRVSGHSAMTAAAVLVALAALSLEPGLQQRIARSNRLRLAWRWFGDTSFSLYLLHMFVVGAVWAILNKLDLPAIVELPIAVIAALAGSAIAASISFHLFEQPLNRMGRKLAARFKSG